MIKLLSFVLSDRYSPKYFPMTLIREHFYPTRVIILGDFRIRAGVTSRWCYQSLVYQVRCYSRSIYMDTHPPRCPSMVLLSLCIKPLSPITLTPRRSRSIRIHLPQPPHLSRFHPRRFIEASTPSSAGSSRSGCLARSLASISAGCIAKSIAV